VCPPAIMMAGMSMASAHSRRPVPVLFLIADTGGGHRSAAQAVAEALLRDHPGRFSPVLLDPLSGPASSRPLRRAVRLYGHVTRHAPWAWGVLYRATDSRRVMRLLRRTLLRFADRPVTDAVTRLQPGVIVSCHPLTTEAAVRASRQATRHTLVATIITDLVSVHAAWPHHRADRVVVPSAEARQRCIRGGVAEGRCAELGLPVSPAFVNAPPPGARQRQEAGKQPFRVVVTGGGEGCGGIARQVSALIRHFDDIEVVAICGRNRRARHKLAKLAARSAGRLTVHGMTDGIVGWLRQADAVATKAGPGTIAEAACCGTALLLTSHLPGQEDGNVELVVTAGAGRYVPRVTDLVREIARLRADPAALEAMRAASARLARPHAAAETATLIAELAGTALAVRPAHVRLRRPSGSRGQSPSASNRPASPIVTVDRGPGPARGCHVFTARRILGAVMGNTG
jgi:1,2-diacylglycerol 3-beta-galactosyltransferase